jgi:hypothetical protein
MVQVAVSGVDLDGVKPGFLGPHGGQPPGSDDLVDLGRGQLIRQTPAIVKGQRAGCDGRAWTLPLVGAPGLSPCVGQLDADGGSFGVNQAHDTGQWLDQAILPQAQVIGADAAPRLDGGGFGDQQAHPAYSPSPVVGQVPIGGQAILGGGVHAHG